MFPEIIQVIPNEDYSVTVYFADGKIVLYDITHLLEKNAFKPLNDREFFMGSCTIMNDTLAWDLSGDRDESKCLDIDPETLYGFEGIEEKIS